MNRLTRSQLGALALAMAVSQPVPGEGVLGSRHDLRTAGTTHACVFCHTPMHSGSESPAIPLWSRKDVAEHFPLYGNAGADDRLIPPGVVSRLCLSCHDGVTARAVAVNEMSDRMRTPQATRAGDGPGRSAPASCEGCVPALGPSRDRPLGTGLRAEHPVAIPNRTNEQHSDYRTPPDPWDGWVGSSRDDVRLFRGAVECGSCHNAHNPAVAPFLRVASSGGGLCQRCHKK